MDLFAARARGVAAVRMWRVIGSERRRCLGARATRARLAPRTPGVAFAAAHVATGPQRSAGGSGGRDKRAATSGDRDVEVRAQAGILILALVPSATARPTPLRVGA